MCIPQTESSISRREIESRDRRPQDRNSGPTVTIGAEDAGYHMDRGVGFEVKHVLALRWIRSGAMRNDKCLSLRNMLTPATLGTTGAGLTLRVAHVRICRLPRNSLVTGQMWQSRSNCRTLGLLRHSAQLYLTCNNCHNHLELAMYDQLPSTLFRSCDAGLSLTGAFVSTRNVNPPDQHASARTAVVDQRPHHSCRATELSCSRPTTILQRRCKSG